MRGGSGARGISIVEFPAFRAEADDLFTAEELDDLRTLLAFSPEAGKIIPGTGGIRKLRCGVEKKHKGTRGGARVIYYFHSDAMPLALLAVYAKTEKIDLVADEKKELRQLVAAYVEAFSGKRS